MASQFLFGKEIWLANALPNVSTLQSSVFITGDLKSQRGFLYTQEVTSFANKVEILLW